MAASVVISGHKGRISSGPVCRTGRAMKLTAAVIAFAVKS